MAGTIRRMTRVVPLARLLAAAQVLMLAREHWYRLEPDERRRVIGLMRDAHGRPRNLSQGDQFELARLIAKANPRLFTGLVAQKFSPVPLPRRVVHGPRRQRP
jgi:hypothetical protein